MACGSGVFVVFGEGEDFSAIVESNNMVLLVGMLNKDDLL